MKLAIDARIIIETDKYADVLGWGKGDILTMDKIRQEIAAGHATITEWINSDLNNDPKPVVIIKF